MFKVRHCYWFIRFYYVRNLAENFALPRKDLHKKIHIRTLTSDFLIEISLEKFHDL